MLLIKEQNKAFDSACLACAHGVAPLGGLRMACMRFIEREENAS